MSQTGVVSWSQTAASNGTADSNINFAEGMAPSQVNDSARALMASVAKWRDDLAGFGLASGPNTYTYTSNQTFNSLSALNGQLLNISFSGTNTVASPTLNVDGLGAKTLTLNGTVGVPIGFITGGTIYAVTFDNATNAFIVNTCTISSFIPPGTIMPFGGSSTPTGWLFCDGSAVSRTTQANLFTAIGVLWGIGDGSTTFNIPDLRGRTLAGLDTGSIRLPSATAVGATGGASNSVIAQANLPNVTFAAGQTINSNQSNIVQGGTIGGAVNGGNAGSFNLFTSSPSQSTISVTIPAVTSGGSGTGLSVIQPTAVINYIIKT